MVVTSYLARIGWLNLFVNSQESPAQLHPKNVPMTLYQKQTSNLATGIHLSADYVSVASKVVLEKNSRGPLLACMTRLHSSRKLMNLFINHPHFMSVPACLPSLPFSHKTQKPSEHFTCLSDNCFSCVSFLIYFLL